jgi:hypothetical protein
MSGFSESRFYVVSSRETEARPDRGKSWGSDSSGACDLVFGLITQIVSSCRKTGQSTEQVAKAIKSGEKAAYFRRKLRNKMGPANYKLRGGSKYAAKIVAAGTELKLQEAREFVKECAPA